ncbi:protein translocase subunit SecD [Verrucomicrobiota bacterium sgz303538]
MSPEWMFISGLTLLVLFGWYFTTDSERLRRILGTALTVLLTVLCIKVAYPPSQKLPLGLDLKGGTSFLIQLVAEPDADGKKREITSSMVEQAVETIRKRVDQLGTSEPIITPSGTDRILVQIPGLDASKLEQTREQLQKVAKLEFRLVHPQWQAIQQGAMPPDPAYTWAKEKVTRAGKTTETQILVRKKADITGDKVDRAAAVYGQKGWEVTLGFTSEGGKLFGDLTEANVNHQFAIMLDGEVISAPNINEPIRGGSASISGNFTEAEARNLASVLENPLQTPVRIEEERSASASLGADSINSGIYSGMIGVVVTIIAVLAYYRFAGLVANIALAINMIILFGAMAMFGTVLTLPGIAGIILTLGMAIDANVLIYERLREEMAAGKPLKAALDAAYEKAFTAIFDSNVTTLITAVILFWKAAGPVKGFAVTLTIGIVASMFTALVVTRNLFAWSLHFGWLKSLSMGNLIKATNFDFMGKRRAAVFASILLIVGSIVLFAARGERNFGVDFKGGDRLVMEATQQKPSLGDVRSSIESLKVGDPVVQMESSAAKEFFTIRSAKDTGQKIEEHLKSAFPQAGFKVEQFEKVGSVVGGELARNSLIALGLGMLGILIYVTLQFEFSFALGALVAILHDVVITIGVFALLGRELSLVIVGAVLTIAGYSVNDTIVVFDRIREGIKSGRKGSVLQIMNHSINETLSRTILTGGVTLLTTAALFFFGGPVLNDFALTILIGVLVGTYSSIFVAAPIVLWWSGHKGEALRTEIQRSDETRPATA